jgi:multidrug resistance efflux pump
MPTGSTENESGAASIESPAGGSADATVDRDAIRPSTDPDSTPVSNQRITPRRMLLIGAVGAVVVATAVFGIPWIRFVLSTVSTDDAFVNGHVTFVAPRGQSLMAVRSLSEIWVDANFKETQLRDLRIGQAADLYVDMYGDKQVFSGRITGFTMGTGSTLALLPPQNATGNYIKIVQRLPVRIELVGYEPDKKPLFIGTSVVPYVHLDKPLSGPNAGTYLQGFEPQAGATVSATSPRGVGE